MSSEQSPSSATDPAMTGEPAAAPESSAVTESSALKLLPGETLAAQRQRLGLSVDEVAMRLRLAPRQIVALEANEFAALPGMATVRGFVRSYAKLLGLPPDPLVAMLSQEPSPSLDAAVRHPLPASGFRSRRYAPPILHRGGTRRLAGLAVVALVFIATLIVVAYRGDWRGSAQDDTGVGAGDVASLSDMAGQDGATPTASMPTVSAPPDTKANPPGAPDATAPVSPRTGQVAAATATTVTAAPTDVLELRASEDAWVEVTGLNRENKILSKLIKAGSTELVAMTEPVALVVGNAAGVQVRLRGQTVDLMSVARENVARLNLK